MYRLECLLGLEADIDVLIAALDILKMARMVQHDGWADELRLHTAMFSTMKGRCTVQSAHAQQFLPQEWGILTAMAFLAIV